MHVIKTPEKYINEPGSVSRAGKILAETAGELKKPLIIAGKKAKDAVEKENFFRSLSENGISIEHIEDFSGYPSQNQFERYAELAKNYGADFIIGIGGGRVLDTSKAAGDITGLPVVTVPSVAATCASWAALTIQYDDEGKYVKHRRNNKCPKIVIADPKVIFTAPERFIFSGVVDTFAKFYEVRPTWERHPEDIPTNVSLAEAKIAFKKLEDNVYKAIVEAKNNVFGQSAQDVIDAIIYLAGLTGSIKSKYGHYSFAHPFYHTSTQLKHTNIKLHGEKVAFGIVTQLILEGKPDSEVIEAIRLFDKYNAAFTLEDFDLKKNEENDLDFLKVQIPSLFPYVEFDGEKIKAALKKASFLTEKYLEAKGE